MRIVASGEARALIDQLWAAGITLTHDPDMRTLRTGSSSVAAVTVGQCR